MHTEPPFERHGRRPRPPFRRRKNRHPGFAERDTPRTPPTPKGEIPPSFAENVFGLVNPLLQHAIAEEGYLTPTPIQQQSIPHLLEGKDLLGCAQTGTGKTAAFLLPILHRLAADPKLVLPGHPRALILAPTRELAAQIATSMGTYGKFIGLPFAVVFGGVSQFPQVTALRRGAALVVATPGRLLDLMEQGHVTLDAVEEFVLDEADRMLDMGFLPDIRRILSKLPEVRHSQFFSATLSPEILQLAKELVKDPVEVTISPEQPTVDKICQRVMFVDKPNKDALLISLLQTREDMTKVIVFARTRHGADKIVRKLDNADIRAEAIHSDKTQRARTVALDDFRRGRVRVLVATDIASRGIDVDGITHVINFDLPMENESYVHRIGRTARAGAAGVAISFVSAEERGLLRSIERLIKMSIEVDNAHEYHSERAEHASGRSGPDQLPRPPWAGKKDRGGFRRDRRDDRPRERPNGQGRRQPDFGRGHHEAFSREDRPPRFERPPREDRPPRDEDRPPRDRRREEPPRRPSERGPDGGAGKWYQSFVRKPHESEGGERPERNGDDRDGERPPRRDEIAGDEHARKPFHKKGGFGKPFNKGGFGKPHSGSKPQFGHGGPRKGGGGGGFKPKRSSRPPWAK